MASPSTHVEGLAQQIGQLETQRATLLTDMADTREARLAAAREGGGAEGGAELNKLQDRVDHARGKLHKLLGRRDQAIDQYERTEHLLASCARSLEKLSLADGKVPGGASAPDGQGRATHSPKTPSPEAAVLPAQLRYTAAEAAAFDRLQQLENKRDEIKRTQASAQLEARDLNKQVQSLTAEADELVGPDNYVLRVAESAPEGLNRYLNALDLPRCDDARNDSRHAQYLEAFTELDGDERRFREEVATPINCFSAFSALHSSTRPNQYVPSLLARLLMDDTGGLDAALRNGGHGLEEAVRAHVTSSFAQVVAEVRGYAARGSQIGSNSGPSRRQTRLPNGLTMNRRDALTFSARNRALLQVLQDVPGQAPSATRTRVIEGAVTHATMMLGQIAEGHDELSAKLKQVKGQLADGKLVQRDLIVQALSVEAQLGEARTDLDAARNERRRAELAESSANASRPAKAAVPETVTVTSSSLLDAEARGMKLRGEIQEHTTMANRSTKEIARLNQDIRAAKTDLRRSEDELEAKAADLARQAANAQLEHAAQGERLAGLRQQLTKLDVRIDALQDKLESQVVPALISRRAWTRAIERHVEPDDAALRARTRETGYSGVYNSQTDMARAVADIHAHVSQQPELRAVLAARTPAEFERAVAAVPGGVTDRVFEHGRTVGRGFSNALDQTKRPTVLTRSSYSLNFEQGRVMVSHVYPSVPVRQLQAIQE